MNDFCGKRDPSGQRVCVLPKGHGGQHEDNYGREINAPNTPVLVPSPQQQPEVA